MKKAEILRRKGIKIRRATAADRAAGRTDLQRRALYIITTSNGQEYYSLRGSLSDALMCEQMSAGNWPAKKKRKK